MGCFKSCPREGGNPPRRASIPRRLSVSSHAPAKGATYIFLSVRGVLKFQVMPPRRGQPQADVRAAVDQQFQVMPPRRGQPFSTKATASASMFQVMPPRRGQPFRRAKSSRRPCFKSCPREGGNFCLCKTFECCEDVSSHAPAKGATQPSKICIDTHNVSSHAPAKGAT